MAQAYDNPANEIARKIQDGDMAAEEVDIERLVHDDDMHLTPALESQLTDDQLRDFERIQREKVNKNAEEKTRKKAHELSDTEQAAIDALNAPEPDDTTTVELRNGVEVEVKTHTNQAIEDKMAKIDDHVDDLTKARAEVVEVLTWFIQSDGYNSPAVWEHHIQEYGTASAYQCLMRCLTPTYDRLENEEAVQKFRNLG